MHGAGTGQGSGSEGQEVPSCQGGAWDPGGRRGAPQTHLAEAAKAGQCSCTERKVSHCGGRERTCEPWASGSSRHPLAIRVALLAFGLPLPPLLTPSGAGADPAPPTPFPPSPPPRPEAWFPPCLLWVPKLWPCDTLDKLASQQRPAQGVHTAG